MSTARRALELHALHELHRERYLQYAALLLSPAEAPLAVNQAFADLADLWQDVLATESPAAHAWQAVRSRVRALAGPHPLPPVAHLTAQQQDVFLLRVVLDLPEDAVAQVTGTAAAAVRVQVRSLAMRPGGEADV
ncbi:sigma factor-like helix-turn-helix DNA-binding protein [Kitasatospora purpeofusca]|uniref:sigma factor-like helix-turn-helix DNA-binding protein n=1 Tax=Kitasatospora purpeofusca TaxID=67352 RepID=UPI0036A70F45